MELACASQASANEPAWNEVETHDELAEGRAPAR
jgi:hypothetical protein